MRMHCFFIGKTHASAIANRLRFTTPAPLCPLLSKVRARVYKICSIEKEVP